MKIFKKDKTYFFALQINTQVSQGIANINCTAKDNFDIDEMLKQILEENSERFTVSIKSQDMLSVKKYPVMNIAILFFTEVQDEGSSKLL